MLDREPLRAPSSTSPNIDNRSCFLLAKALRQSSYRHCRQTSIVADDGCFTWAHCTWLPSSLLSSWVTFSAGWSPSTHQFPSRALEHWQRSRAGGTQTPRWARSLGTYAHKSITNPKRCNRINHLRASLMKNKQRIASWPRTQAKISRSVLLYLSTSSVLLLILLAEAGSSSPAMWTQSRSQKMPLIAGVKRRPSISSPSSICLVDTLGCCLLDLSERCRQSYYCYCAVICVQ